MALDQRIKGQEVSIRIIQAGVVLTQIDSISSFNETIALRLLEQGYLGEVVNRFDEILDGFGGDMEMHFTRADWNDLVEAILSRARRDTPDVVFNVIRTDLYPNGDSSLYTYRDVKWGPIPTNIPTRGDFVKAKFEFRSSERPAQVNALP